MSPLRKGTELLIKALKYTNSKKYKVIIHSQVDLKICLTDIIGYIEVYISLGIQEIMVSTVPDPGLYHLDDIYVYPSILDGIVLTIAETISSGLALIVPDCAPMNELVGEGFCETVPVELLYSRSDEYYWPKNEVNPINLTQKMTRYFSDNINISNVEGSSA